jgi:hypothetical protein
MATFAQQLNEYVEDEDRKLLTGYRFLMAKTPLRPRAKKKAGTAKAGVRAVKRKVGKKKV